MPKVPTQLTHAFADRLAELVLSDDSSRALGLLQISGLFEMPSVSAGSTPESGPHGSALVASQQEEVDRIGIWERKAGSTQFVRREDKASEWEFWASLGEIPPKSTGNKKRIILLGESVARGYFYDPQFTPALALECMLQSHFGRDGVEVIDLARTDLTGPALRELAISALGSLEPDAVLIFGGNNWRSAGVRGLLSGEDFPFLDTLLRDHGIAGIKRFIEERLVAEAQELVRDIASLYQSKEIPLLWVIPEFNLADWRDPAENAPVLPSNSNREWSELRHKATAALLDGDLCVTLDAARRMNELDGGACATAFHLLAECSRWQGDRDSAKRNLELARDAVIWDPSIGSPSPRAYSVVQAVLREEPVKFQGNSVLDLPRHFDQHLQDALPGRQLFLDYCHMTAEGINLAMAEAASRIVKTLDGQDLSWQALISHGLQPTAKISAEASFLAAIHNAHWYQSQELVSYHLQAALRLAPEIAGVALQFAQLQCRRQPMYLYEAVQQLADPSWPSVQLYLFQMLSRKQNHQLDRTLIDAILETLDPNTSQGLMQVLCDEHSLTSAPANLLERYYSAAAAQPREALWVTPGYSSYKKNDYYQAYSQHSHFLFVSDGSCAVLLTLTCRLPQECEKAVRLEVNGRCHTEFYVTHEWSTWDFYVPLRATDQGINEVVIEWPMLEGDGGAIIDTALDSIRNKLLPDLYFSFGEVHSLTAKAVEDASLALDEANPVPEFSPLTT